MALKKQYQVFVDEMVAHGDEKKAVKKAYPETKGDHAIRKQCLRLSQNVSVQEAIRQRSNKIESIATQMAADELKDKIVSTALTRERKLEILRQIAEGALEIPVKKPVWDRKEEKYVFVPMMELPDHATRMKAIDLDNKMVGDYAPEKKDLSVNGFASLLIESSDGE